MAPAGTRPEGAGCEVDLANSVSADDANEPRIGHPGSGRRLRQSGRRRPRERERAAPGSRRRRGWEERIAFGLAGGDGASDEQRARVNASRELMYMHFAVHPRRGARRRGRICGAPARDQEGHQRDRPRVPATGHVMPPRHPNAIQNPAEIVRNAPPRARRRKQQRRRSALVAPRVPCLQNSQFTLAPTATARGGPHACNASSDGRKQ